MSDCCEKKTMRTMAQISYNGFPTLNSKVAQLSVFYC